MADTPIDAADARRESLMRALDGHDAQAIEDAAAALASAMEDLRGLGAGKSAPAVRAQLNQLAADLDVARMRVNYLGDQCRRRISGMAALRGRAIGQTYAR